MRCVKSPRRTRSVPANSSCTEPVIERASAKPITSAAPCMTRKSAPTTASSHRKIEPHVDFSDAGMGTEQVLVQGARRHADPEADRLRRAGLPVRLPRERRPTQARRRREPGRRVAGRGPGRVAGDERRIRHLDARRGLDAPDRTRPERNVHDDGRAPIHPAGGPRDERRAVRERDEPREPRLPDPGREPRGGGVRGATPDGPDGAALGVDDAAATGRSPRDWARKPASTPSMSAPVVRWLPMVVAMEPASATMSSSSDRTMYAPVTSIVRAPARPTNVTTRMMGTTPTKTYREDQPPPHAPQQAPSPRRDSRRHRMWPSPTTRPGRPGCRATPSPDEPPPRTASGRASRTHRPRAAAPAMPRPGAGPRPPIVLEPSATCRSFAVYRIVRYGAARRPRAPGRPARGEDRPTACPTTRRPASARGLPRSAERRSWRAASPARAHGPGQPRAGRFRRDDAVGRRPLPPVHRGRRRGIDAEAAGAGAADARVRRRAPPCWPSREGLARSAPCSTAIHG